MNTIEDKIYAKIKRHGRGWVMTNRDFGDLGNSASIDWALYRLKECGIIRSVLRGIYVYPRYSELLEEEIPPALHDIAHTIARKNQWNIQVSGNEALNALGISTQIPVKAVYHSDGPSRRIQVDSRTIIFKHVSLKESKIASPKSQLVVQALETLGPKHVDSQICAVIRHSLTSQDCKKLKAETKYAKAHIREACAKICSIEKD